MSARLLAVLTVLAVGFATLAPFAAARAAPQALGLIASAEPVPLQCTSRECAAELTAFCLEQHRRAPSPDTPYYVYDPASLRLEGVRADGSVVALDDAGEALRITALRSHTAVRVALPRPYLRAHGVEAVRIAVAPFATLIPVPVAGDRNPHSEADIALAAGPLRRAAAVIIDDGGAESLDAVRLAARLINALPARGRASERQRAGVWQEALGDVASPGARLARAGFERCAEVTRSGMMSLRQCLGSWHDSLIGDLNDKYWKAIETGS